MTVIESAREVLIKAQVEEGFLASSTPKDNYKRVWARDATMTGIAALFLADDELIEGLRASLDTLMQYAHPVGFIPSNVQPDNGKTSYGSIVGRVDATLWYIIGVGLYYQYTNDETFKTRHLATIQKALYLADAWEMNGRGLIYSPLSGNWADEYPIHGYTLYDNCLRLWGLHIWRRISPNKIDIQKVIDVHTIISSNFYIDSNDKGKYHQILYDRQLDSPSAYYEAGFNPARYYHIFDAAGNGLALLLGLYNDKRLKKLASYLSHVRQEIGSTMVPAFWPVIQPGDELWNELKLNYGYSFKNNPYHFHNGGIWPIMMGWLSMGLRTSDMDNVCARMKEEYDLFCASEKFKFSEYINSKNLKGGGNDMMCYSAVGAIFMHQTKDRITKILGIPS